MFVIETESGDVRLESVAEATTYLEALAPGARVTVRGLGRLELTGDIRPRPRPPLVVFYPVGVKRLVHFLVMADIVAMLPAMVEG